MAVTNRFYGGNSRGANRTVPDFGLCDTKGNYVYTTKLRPKGLLVVAFFAPDSPPSAPVLKAIQGWTTEMPTEKWTALAVCSTERDVIVSYAEQNGLDKLTFLLDYEYYQTRNWGVTHIPSVFLISGKTGRVLQRVVGNDVTTLGTTRDVLKGEIDKIVAAEAAAAEAARKAEEEKKAAAAAAAATAPATDKK